MFLISNVVYANVKLKFSELVQVDKLQRGTNSGHHFHVHTRSKDADWKCVCPRSFRKQQVSITLSYESASQSCRGYVSHPGTRLGLVPLLSQQLILTLTDVPALSGGGQHDKKAPASRECCASQKHSSAAQKAESSGWRCHAATVGTTVPSVGQLSQRRWSSG